MSIHVERIQWADCQKWRMDESSLHHVSRRFFSVVFVSDGSREHVMIDQPEIGILAFAVAGNGRQRQWLIQHKPEPGNVNYTQWAPTVQATLSNYQQVHGGRATPFLELFTDTKGLLEDVLGSEQGDRFLNKFNRNCKRLFEQSFSVGDHAGQFSWISNAELKAHLRRDYSVNTDARSVLVSGSWDLVADSRAEIFLGGGLTGDIAEALHRSYHTPSTERQSQALGLLVRMHENLPRHYRRIPLRDLREHRLSADGIYNSNGQRVLGYFDCRMPEREVSRWQQPLIEREHENQYVLLLTIRDGVAFFYVAVSSEVGFHHRVEFGPSLHGAVSEVSARLAEAEPLLEIRQSDEGGRFHRNIGRYCVAVWHGDPKRWCPSKGRWLTAADLERLSTQKGVLNNELRTLLSLLLSVA